MAFRSVTFWLGSAFLLVGVPFLITGIVLGIIQDRDQEQLEAEGVLTEATILDRSVVRRDRSTRYMVDFRFQARSGETIQGSVEMEQPAWAKLAAEEGGLLAVRYAASDPSLYRVHGQKSNWFLPYIFGGLGAAFAIAGGILFWISVTGIGLYRRLYREGMPTLAEIIEVGPSNVRINNVRQWRIRYRYHDSMGGVHEGKSPYLPPERAQQWAVGESTEVRFDSRKPTLNAWIGRR